MLGVNDGVPNVELEAHLNRAVVFAFKDPNKQIMYIQRNIDLKWPPADTSKQANNPYRELAKVAIAITTFILNRDTVPDTSFLGTNIRPTRTTKMPQQCDVAG